MSTTLDEARIQRYSRQIVLPEIGGHGQERLLATRVLLVGAGGLGCPVGLYLAGAGIGHIGIVDDDQVDASNLHRQIGFDTNKIGQSKARLLAQRLRALNPDCQSRAHDERLTDFNAPDLITQYDIIADGSDNLKTRRLVHDYAMRLGKPLISAAVQGMDGQLTVYRAFAGSADPCMYCRGSGEMDESLLPSCAGGGVLGPAAGVIGSLQAAETIKVALGIEPVLSGTLLLFDIKHTETMMLAMPSRDDCQFCASLHRK